MTNFFGSAMEILHTDSAYKSHSNVDVREAKRTRQTDHFIFGSERRILRNMNYKDQVSSNLITEVTTIYAIWISST